MPHYTFEQVQRVVKFWCWDCGGQCPAYLVHNDVWQKAWPDRMPIRDQLARLATEMFPNAWRRDANTGRVSISICLCFPCLSRRLGRELYIDDFQELNRHGRPLPINASLFLGFQLGQQAAARALQKKADESGDKKDEGG